MNFIYDLIEPRKISKEYWVEYIKNLYRREEDVIEQNDTPEIDTNVNIKIEITDIEQKKPWSGPYS